MRMRVKYFSIPSRASRLCHRVILSHKKGFLGRIVSKLLRDRLAIKFGIYLSPLARIGDNFKLPHPIGIVIGDGVVVGKNVTIYQNVTLGRRHEDEASYPIVEDGVIIYAGAVVVGQVTLGKNSIIAANSVVHTDVPEGSVYGGVPARKIGTL